MTTRALPRDVHRQITRHGKAVFYWRNGHGRRVRLPDDPASRQFEEAIKLARSGLGQPFHPVIMTVAEMRKQRIERALRIAVYGARKRSAGRPCDLTLEWALAQAEKQQFRCALSGIPFYEDAALSAGRHPYAPSLDRVEPGGLYVRTNVRVISYAMNVMLLDWGPSIFERVANGYRVNRSKLYSPTEADGAPT